MRALFVGAGAVGAVYGYHLARGGAAVTYLVKPRHAEATRAGMTVYPLNRRGARGSPERFTEYDVVTEVSEAEAPWDQVWLCVSSTALRAGDWLDRLTAVLRQHAPEATLVALQPGLEDRAWICERHPEAGVVSGLISLISYQSPLPTERLEPGFAWWFPPGGPSPFSGERRRVDAVVGALRAGGCPAKRARDVPGQTAFGAAIMMPVIAGLEAAGWSLSGYPKHPAWALARRAARQTTAVARPGVRRWLVHLLTVSVVLRLGLGVARRVIPLDLETYLEFHFTKVGDQTRAALQLYLERAAERGLPRDAIEGLSARLP